jgi:hypothetical protein
VAAESVVKVHPKLAEVGIEHAVRIETPPADGQQLTLTGQASRKWKGGECRDGTPAHPLTARGPFPPHLVGAKSKDAVENALHREVCAGTLTLREAQWIIATDWFKYYRERVLH